MATGDSVIRVAILGDTKDITKAIDGVDKKLGNFGKAAKIAAGGFLAFQAAGGAVDFVGGALEKADDYADALDRIAGLATPAFAQTIEDIAFDFTAIGLSADEVASMAASFLALGTSAGITEDALLTATPEVLKIAAAIAATTGKTIDEVITDIGKAAAGSKKPVADYGIVIDEALNPDQQLLSILEQAKKLFPDVASATGDLAGKQNELGAKWDNFTIKLGEALEGPLGDTLDWLTDMIDAIPSAIEGWKMLGGQIETFGRTVLGPLGNVADVLGEIVRLLPGAQQAASLGTGLLKPAGGGDLPGRSESGTGKDQKNTNDRNGIVNNKIGGP